MTSLINAHLGALFASGIVALVLPAWTLWPATDEVPEHAAPTIRTISIAEPPTMNAAIAAIPFSPTRDPDFVPVAVDKDGAVPPATLPPRLVGLVSRQRGEAVALIVGADGQTIIAKKGDSVDGWTLASVSAGQAKFQRGGERRSVVLDYSNKVIPSTMGQGGPE